MAARKKRSSLDSMISALAAPGYLTKGAPPRPAPAKSPRMGYLKLTREGLMSKWFERATEKRSGFKSLGETPVTVELWDTMMFNPEGMVTTGPKNAEIFLNWARKLEGWKDSYVIWEPTGEKRI